MNLGQTSFFRMRNRLGYIRRNESQVLWPSWLADLPHAGYRPSDGGVGGCWLQAEMCWQMLTALGVGWGTGVLRQRICQFLCINPPTMSPCELDTGKHRTSRRHSGSTITSSVSLQGTPACGGLGGGSRTQHRRPALLRASPGPCGPGRSC